MQEDTVPLVSGQLTATDPDTGDSFSFRPVTDVSGDMNLGAFTIDENGAWNYTLDNNNPVVQALALNETVIDTYTYSVIDENGAIGQETIAIEIRGTNDAPTGMSLDMDCIDENIMFDPDYHGPGMPGGEQAGMVVGTLTATDVDGGDSFTFEIIEDDPSQYNWFEIGGANSDQIVVKQNVDLNHEVREFHEVKVRVTDGAGETYIETFTIQVKDVNEPPQEFILSLEGDLYGNPTPLARATGAEALTSPTAVAVGNNNDYITIYAATREEGAGEGTFLMAIENGEEPIQISESEVALGSRAAVTELLDATGAPTGEFVVMYQTAAGELVQRHFDSRFANALDSETPVATTAGGTLTDFEVEALDTGGYAVAFDRDWISVVRIFENDGTPRTGEIFMSQANAADADLSELNDGTLVVVYEADDADASGVYLEMFDPATGASLGAPVLVNQTTDGNQTNPEVVTRTDGTGAVMWQEERTDGTWAVMVRDLDVNGVPTGNEYAAVENLTVPVELSNAIATIDNGFWVGWTQDDGTGDQDVWGARYDTIGRLVGDTPKLVYDRAADTVDPFVIERSGGSLVFVWDAPKLRGEHGRGVGVLVTDAVGDKNSTLNGLTPTLSNDDNYTPEAVASLDGGYTIFFRSEGVDGSGYALLSQKYDIDGVAVGTPVTVNTDPVGDQGFPSAAQLVDFGYVVAWESNGDIVMQRWASDEQTLGGNQVVNSTVTGEQTNPAVAALDDGGFVVVWHDENQGVVLQQYNNDGFPEGGEVVVSNDRAADTTLSAAGLNDGSYVVTWENAGGDIAVQRYDATGNPTALPFLANASNTGNQGSPKVAALEGGGYVIAWDSDAGEDGDAGSVLATVYNADGSVRIAEFVVNQNAAFEQQHPEVIGLTDGGFMITWESEHEADQVTEVWGQRFDANGNRVAAEFSVTVPPPNDDDVSVRHAFPAMAELVNGNVAVAWHFEDSDRLEYEGVLSQLLEQQPDEDAPSGTVVATIRTTDIDEGDNHTYVIDSVVGGPLLSDGVTPAYTNAELQAMFEIANVDEIRLAAGSTFKNLASFNQNFDIQVTATDQGGLTLTDTITIQVYGGIDSPTDIILNGNPALDTLTANEGDSGIVVATLSANDPDIDDVHTWEVLEDVGVEYNIFEIVNGNELAIKAGVNLDHEVRAIHEVSVQVTDLLGGTHVETFTINITDINETPEQIFLSPEGDLVGTAQKEVDEQFLTGRPSAEPLALPDGSYVVFFTSDVSYREQYILAQKFNADGTESGGRIPLFTEGYFENPAILLDTGEIVIGTRFNLRVFDQNLNLLAGPSNAVSGTGRGNYLTDFAPLGGGTFVEVFHHSTPGNYEVYFRVYDQNLNELTAGEVKMNQFSSSSQQWPSVTPTADGGFLAVWQSAGQDLDEIAVVARKYNSDYTPAGNDYVVNSSTIGYQQQPDVTTLDNGDLVVVWASSNTTDVPTAIGWEIIGRILNPDGSFKSVEFHVSEEVPGTQREPEVISLSDGGFLVAWEWTGTGSNVYDIRAQRFDASGNKVGAIINVANDVDDQTRVRIEELQNGDVVAVGNDENGPGAFHVLIKPDGTVDSSPVDIFADQIGTGEPGRALIAMNDGTFLSIHQESSSERFTILDANGNVIGTPDQDLIPGNFAGIFEATKLSDGSYVIIGSAYGDQLPGTGSSIGIQAVRMSADGVPFTDPVWINTTIAGHQRFPSITALDDGGYVAVWSDHNSATDGSSYAIVQQRFDTDGKPTGGEVVVNATTAGLQDHPAVENLADGGYVVAWHSADGSGYGIYVRRFNADGTPAEAGERLVNTTTAATQDDVDVAGLEGGGYVVVWEDNGNDGEVLGIYAQVFDASDNPVGTEFQVNTVGAGDQAEHQVLALNDGGFLITWDDAATRTDYLNVRAQRFDANGNRIGAEFQVNQDTDGNSSFPLVAQNADGTILFTWSYHDDTGKETTETRSYYPAVAEEVPGIVIGTLGVTDPDVEDGDTHTYALTNPSTMFEVVEQPAASGNWVLKLQAGQSLDYETATSHTVSITVTDSASNAFVQDVTFQVADVSGVPIVIDLNRDGEVSFRNIEDGARFDMDGDGELEQTAWAGEGDALLAYDKDGDGDITDTDEISFAGYVEGARTDLEGLRHFDTNNDGVLDASDEEFEKFNLWQDADGDGNVDEGELVSLYDAGVESISLTSDEAEYDPETGDVHVHGEATVTFTDGTTGSAADAAFDYREIVEGEEVDLPFEVTLTDGESIDLHGNGGEELGEATPDLLEEHSDTGPSQSDGLEGGAPSAPLSAEDDAAAAGAGSV